MFVLHLRLPVYVALCRQHGNDSSLILCLSRTYNSTGGNYDSRFDVGKASGTLIVAQPLDSEQKSNYNLTVEATDGTRTVSTQVIEPLMKRSGPMRRLSSLPLPRVRTESVDIRNDRLWLCFTVRKTQGNRLKHGK